MIYDAGYWKHHWKILTALPSQRRELPIIIVGCSFLDDITMFTNRVVNCKGNTEWMIVFPIVLFKRNKGDKLSKDTRGSILHKLDLWNKGGFGAIKEDTESTNQRK